MGQNNGNIQYNGSAADNVYFMIAQVCDHIWVCLELKQLDCYVNWKKIKCHLLVLHCI